MGRAPWVKWYAGDFLNGIADLEPNEIALYAVVLNRIYDEGGPIADDVAKIARRCNMRPTSAGKALDALVAAGKLERRDGLLTNSRCEKEIESREKVAQKSTEAANVRWGNLGEKANENNHPAHADALPAHCEGNATRSQKPEIEKAPSEAFSISEGSETKSAMTAPAGLLSGKPPASAGGQKAPEPARHQAPLSRVFVAFDTPEWTAWSTHLRSIGKTPYSPASKHDDRNGWWFPSLTPPVAGAA